MGETYICKDCGLTLAIVVEQCYCGQSRGFDITESQEREWKRDWRIFPTMTNEKRIEIYTKFFAQGLSEGETRSIQENDKWLDELEEAIVTAKATYNGVDESNRKKKAGLSKEERERLQTKMPTTATDALVQPKIRKERQTQADKLQAILVSSMGDEEADAALRKLNITPIIKEKEKQDRIEGKPAQPESFTFNKEKKEKEAVEKVIPKSNTTQESLLADLLEMVDLESTDLKALIQKNNTAEMLLSKTTHKLMPDKMILLKSRIAELIEIGEAKVRQEAQEKQLIQKTLEEKMQSQNRLSREVVKVEATTHTTETADKAIVESVEKKLAWNPFAK